MDDLISRQAAIDALKQFKPEIIPYEKARSYVEETIDTMYDRIEELPSVQPVATDTNVGDTTHKNVIYSPVQMAMDYAVNAMDFSASSDTISRQAAIDEIERLILPQVKGETAAEEINRVAWRCAINCAEKMIVHLPSAERRGRWEMKEDPYGFFDTIPVCSACGCTTKYRVTSAYCPNCGARMVGEEE